MKLSKKQYIISAETLEKVCDALDLNRSCVDEDGDEWNNDEVIEADDLLEKEVKRQEET